MGIARAAARSDRPGIRSHHPAGGIVNAALAIYNALKAREPTVYIDGIAASAASLIAMAESESSLPENALVMVHDPHTGSIGNSGELRKKADELDIYRDADAACLRSHRTGPQSPAEDARR